MALYRCAACGSPNVVTDTQSGNLSYDYKKGIVGTMVLGTGGAVAGLKNKTQKVFKCPDCGVTLTYPMDQELKMVIDLGVMDDRVRSNLKYAGVSVSWETLTAMYKNIESGLADQMIQARETRKRQNLLAYATATQEEFDSAVDLLADYERRFNCNGSIYDTLPSDAFTDETPMTLTEYYAWYEAINLFVENMAKYLPVPLPPKYRELNKYNMELYFIAYLFEGVRLEYGEYPKSTNKLIDCKELNKYAADNPFVLYYANHFLKEKSPSFRSSPKEADPWTTDNFNEIIDRAIGIRPWYGAALEKVFCLFPGIDGKEILVSQIVPKYTVINGRLCFHLNSNPRPFTGDKNEAIRKAVQNAKNNVKDTSRYTAYIEDYFAFFPEKRAAYDAKIAEHIRLLSEKDQMKVKLETLKSDINLNNSRIRSKQYEIDALQNKIFGKKKALAQAEVLKQDSQKLRKQNEEMEAEIEAINKRNESVIDDKTFYRQLVKDMDYFIVWRQVQSAAQ